MKETEEMTAARQKQANEWQLIGHKTKTETHNLFMTFVVATIGFAASAIFFCDCRFLIIRSCFAAPLYYISVIVLFIVLFMLFEQTKMLRKIAFEYSTVLGSPQQDGEWDEIIKMHSKYYWNFNAAFYLYLSALILLIVAILIGGYN